MNLKSQQKNKWKSKYIKIEHASNLHKKMQEILCNGKFSSIEAYQEVPVSSIVDTIDVLFIDWYIPMFRVCIELHGIQHYEPIAFIKEDKIKTELNFITSKGRDFNKKFLIESNGFKYIEISYKDLKSLDESFFIEKLNQSKE